jgi:hypothetical protein
VMDAAQRQVLEQQYPQYFGSQPTVQNPFAPTP